MQAQLVTSPGLACRDGMDARHPAPTAALQEPMPAAGARLAGPAGVHGGLAASLSVTYSFSPESVKLLGDAVDAVTDGVSQVASSVTGTMSRIGEAVADGAKDTLDTVFNGVNALAKTSADAAVAVVEAAGSSATAIAGQALDTAEDVAGAAVQAAGDLKDAALSLSRSTTAGLDRATDAGAEMLGKAASYALIAALGAGSLLHD